MFIKTLVKSIIGGIITGYAVVTVVTSVIAVGVIIATVVDQIGENIFARDKKIKEGLEKGTIVKHNGQYYEVVITENNDI